MLIALFGKGYKNELKVNGECIRERNNNGIHEMELSNNMDLLGSPVIRGGDSLKGFIRKTSKIIFMFTIQLFSLLTLIFFFMYNYWIVVFNELKILELNTSLLDEGKTEGERIVIRYLLAEWIFDLDAWRVILDKAEELSRVSNLDERVLNAALISETIEFPLKETEGSLKYSFVIESDEVKCINKLNDGNRNMYNNSEEVQKREVLISLLFLQKVKSENVKVNAVRVAAYYARY